ncbi:AMP-binding protein [Stenotrophobium rhamnosiphilum]|uniref:Cyclohexanecarboxylate-CoA ligase n=1 Tax=Stenotrophobium rhamnosiphilum TaxID=2029166 RepID=A0A2T5MD09_9GAMM|nr:AMP-binding protein [Stenotrophobium rhamnosiphilum]PTU30455.1 cyclohexanecarboxylate-CoA ligase [Stenotrophobium rhamnosiphilum]
MPNEITANRKTISGRSIRWDEARAARAYAEGHWIHQTLADALQHAAKKTPDRVLLIDDNQRINCAQLHSQATQLAHAMLSRAHTGSVVSFLLPNWHEAAVIYLAATIAGMVVNPILPSLRDHDLQFILKDVNTRLVFVPAQFRQHDYVEMLNRVVAQLESPPEVVVLRGDAGPHTAYNALLQQGDDSTGLPLVNPDAVRMVLYTSGTTGRPKGVLHTHNTLHALLCQIRQHWLVEPGDKFLVPSPISHIGGSIYAFESPLLLGTTAVLMERWDAAEAVRIIESERCTHMAGATPFLQQLLNACETAGTRQPSLKVFICGGASVPPSLIRKATDYFKNAVVTRVYGSTEVPVTTVGATLANETTPAADTDGRRGFAEIKLVGHGSAPPNEGEVHARGPQMLVGYLHQEDEAASFDAEGYFRTGDLARMQDDTYLVINGRAKDIIIRNGENISPKEVEDILVGHPQIAEIAIVGVADSKTGERACAVIVIKGADAPDVDNLRNYLKALGVASFKAPEQVAIWDALPKNDAGKVLKHQIRATLAQNA